MFPGEVGVLGTGGWAETRAFGELWALRVCGSRGEGAQGTRKESGQMGHGLFSLPGAEAAAPWRASHGCEVPPGSSWRAPRPVPRPPPPSSAPSSAPCAVELAPPWLLPRSAQVTQGASFFLPRHRAAGCVHVAVPDDVRVVASAVRGAGPVGSSRRSGPVRVRAPCGSGRGAGPGTGSPGSGVSGTPCWLTPRTLFCVFFPKVLPPRSFLRHRLPAPRALTLVFSRGPRA